MRTVQPVLEDLDPALEEAAQTLGGSDRAIFVRVILPLLAPALLAGVSLSFARSLGEFGAIIFIAGNQPMQTEITALLAFIRLEEYDYQAAAAIASVLLITAFLMLAVTNLHAGARPSLHGEGRDERGSPQEAAARRRRSRRAPHADRLGADRRRVADPGAAARHPHPQGLLGRSSASSRRPSRIRTRATPSG